MNKKHWSKKAKIGLLVPLITLGAGGGTVGGIAIAGYVFGVGPMAPGVTNVSTIFGPGFAWDTNSYNQGSENNPLPANPSNDAISARILKWMHDNGKTPDSVVNDLSYTGPIATATENQFNITATASGSAWTGSFIISVYIEPSHVLSLTNTMVDYSSISSSITVGKVIDQLASLNSGLIEDAVYISTSGFTDKKVTIERNNASSLWTQYDTINHYYAYQFTLSPIANGWYEGSTPVTIYVSLQRTTYNSASLFGATPTLTRRFPVTPSIEQVRDAFNLQYSGTTSPFNYTDFYGDGTNLEFTVGGTLTYGDANQFYTSGSTTFILNVDTPIDIAAQVFVSDLPAASTQISIASDTATNPIILNARPTTTDLPLQYTNIKALLLARYVNGYQGEQWSKFQNSDFSSMNITSAADITISSGTTGFYGTIKISSVPNSTIYSGNVIISWQTYDFS